MDLKQEFNFTYLINDIRRLTMLNSKKLLLIDFAGALSSTFLLGVVLVQFQSIFGMPSDALYFLSIVACCFAIYSLSSYFITRENRKVFLRVIAYANTIYCCVTLGLIIYFKDSLTLFGFMYFITEMVIITVLAIIEFKVSRNNNNN